MEEKAHRWVRHLVTDIDVRAEDPELLNHDEFSVWVEVDGLWMRTSTRLDAQQKVAYGCDDCGLGLTTATLNEPCLSELEDQMEGED